MALITFEDIQKERNIDLTVPNGQEVAETLIAAAVASVEAAVGYQLEEGERTSYFSNGYEHLWLPTRAPTSGLVLHRRIYGTTYETLSADEFEYDPDTGEVWSFASLPSGLKAVKAVYTAGWTAATLPRDLRGALIDMVALKLQQVNNFSASAPGAVTEEDESEGEGNQEPTGAIKKYSVDGFSVEYSSAETDAYWKAKAAQMAHTIGDGLPESIKEVVARYRLSFAN